MFLEEKYWQSYKSPFHWVYQMAEAGMAAFGAAVGVAIALAVVCFAFRGKGHPEPLD